LIIKALQDKTDTRRAADLRNRDALLALLQDERLLRVREPRCLHVFAPAQPCCNTGENSDVVRRHFWEQTTTEEARLPEKGKFVTVVLQYKLFTKLSRYDGHLLAEL